MFAQICLVMHVYVYNVCSITVYYVQLIQDQFSCLLVTGPEWFAGPSEGLTGRLLANALTDVAGVALWRAWRTVLCVVWTMPDLAVISKMLLVGPTIMGMWCWILGFRHGRYVLFSSSCTIILLCVDVCNSSTVCQIWLSDDVIHNY